ncbi:MAG: NifB/NifX family molybdenum-iron cluster-binding protein [Desulfuromonadaceae bacterium]|nr:NifB/NifX family molybdenum-iron cluster-binding protein [Desulfuromonadaceae bacterium]MDD5104993.1 NifB/NifX family molybdenum-iron cluster-binding protein [Desulfuromonadaceae bacterium]
MKICFPVIADDGAESILYGHFASAPFFAIIDTETGLNCAIANCDQNNPFAGCNPFSALSRQQLDGIVVGSIGDDSVRVMNMCGFKVFQASSQSLADNVALFESSSLPEVEVLQSHLEGRCNEGESGHACNHHSH